MNRNDKIPYCKAAIFTCNCCVYSTTIYSDTEWLEVTESLFCKKCKGTCEDNCDTGIIYRDDIDEENPLHMQFANLPAGKHHCDNCVDSNQIHWTELIVHCHACNKDTMLFTAYCIGKNILEFYEQCLDQSKPDYPLMMWIDKEGNELFVISGTGAGFSST
jgi:hypothetical protein